MAGRVRFQSEYACLRACARTRRPLQRRSAVMSRCPTRSGVCKLSSLHSVAFSKPHTPGREHDRLGRDLALCATKQKSLGTINNKSIQKKRSFSPLRENKVQGRKQLLGEKKELPLMCCGYWATDQAVPARS